MDRTCNVDNCIVSVHAKGMCARHYRQDYHRRNKEKVNARNAEWRARNPDYWRSKDPVRKSMADKRYAAKNRETRAENERLRRIAKADAIALERRSPAGRDRNRRAAHAEMLEVYGTDCYLCLEPIDLDAPRHAAQGEGWEQGLHREHVIPISRGGENTLENCRPAHAACNLRKGAVV